MRTFSDMKKAHPKALLKQDVVASYYSDGDKVEWLYFKLLPLHVVRYITKGLQQMRVFPHYRLERCDELYRNGYVNEKLGLQMLERDEALLTIPDVKRITSELVEAMGYRLHWIPVTRILNMKYKL